MGVKKILNIAHRGASAEAPENTLAAFRRAIEIGVHGFELDVHLTKDRVIVAIHDESVDRTTNGSGLVHEMTLQELQSLDAGSWFNHLYSEKAHESFCLERIPTLRQVIDLAKGKNLCLCIEIKNAPFPQIGFEAELVRLIEENKIQNQVLVLSFDHSSVRKVKQLNPTIKTAVLLASKPVDPIIVAKTATANVIAMLWDFCSAELVQQVHKAGLTIWAWTVDDPQAMRKLKAMGADAIISNKPDVLKRILSQV